MKSNNYIEDMKKWIILILVGVFSYWVLNNLGVIFSVIGKVFGVFIPFILGGAIAFILNIPMTGIENFLKKHINNTKLDSSIRVISIIISLLIFIGIIVFVAFLLIPEVIESLELLISNIPVVLEKIERFVLDLLDKSPDIQKQIEQIFSESGNVSGIISSVLNHLINGAIGLVTGLISSFATLFTAVVFSIYMLCQKEYLLKGVKKLVYAFCGNKVAKKVFGVGELANNIFAKFISGQCVEAVILGCIMFVFFLLFRFPYALLIAVLTTITALIPIFGAMFAMAIGTILIAITDPIQAVVFIIVFQVVQQIEGNFIYPRVVGKSVGLSPIWTLLAITVGGSLFGIVGMFLALPIAAVGSGLIKKFIQDKMKEKI